MTCSAYLMQGDLRLIIIHFIKTFQFVSKLLCQYIHLCSKKVLQKTQKNYLFFTKCCTAFIIIVKIYCFRYLTHVIDSNPHIYFLAHTLPLLGNFPAFYFLHHNSLQIIQNLLFLFALKLLYKFSRRVAVQASRMLG